jgi:hypothetical protein
VNFLGFWAIRPRPRQGVPLQMQPAKLRLIAIGCSAC